MDELVRASILFWLPVSLMILGLYMRVGRGSDLVKKFGVLIIVISSILFLLSPITVPSSPSTEIAQLSWYLIPVGILTFAGLYLISFSGEVVVGKIDDRYKMLGVLLLLLAVTGLLSMQFGNFTPKISSDDSVNRYWLVFWPTFLIAGISVSSFGIVISKSKIPMSSCLAFFIVLFCLSTFVDGSQIDSETFRKTLWLVGADLLGLLLGGGMSVAVFAGVIYAYEKSLPTPLEMGEPTEDDWNLVKKHLESNLEVKVDE